MHVCRRHIGLLLLLAFFAALPLRAQQPAGQSPGVRATPAEIAADKAATLTNMTALRDHFVRRLQEAGFSCPFAPPRVSVEHVPSFGQYDDQTDALRTAAWTLLSPQERAFFFELVGPGATEASTRAAFERAAHGWIFVHEMGHWWQKCRGYLPGHTHYEVEYGANRIALAWWRTYDPGVSDEMIGLAHAVLDHAPSPVPAGQTVEAYFNQNYEALGPTPAYPWFQSRMNVTAAAEMPQPSLNAVLASVKR